MNFDTHYVEAVDDFSEVTIYGEFDQKG